MVRSKDVEELINLTNKQNKKKRYFMDIWKNQSKNKQSKKNPVMIVLLETVIVVSLHEWSKQKKKLRESDTCADEETWSQLF